MTEGQFDLPSNMNTKLKIDPAPAGFQAMH